MVTDTASCPVDWRLFVPESWDPASPKVATDVHLRRSKAGIGDDIGHREKWRLALDMIDELIAWGLRPPLIVADSGYGDAAEFRHGLAQRSLSYVVQVTGANLSGYPADTVRTTPAYSGYGSHPRPRYPQPAPSLAEIVTGLGPGAAGVLAPRFSTPRRAGPADVVAVRVHPGPPGRPGPAHRPPRPGPARDVADRRMAPRLRRAGQVLVVEPARHHRETDPDPVGETALAHRTRLPRSQTGPGLDHYEGRTWQGWHHHVTLVSAAHAFCTLQRLDPKTPAPE
jgi:hypothetical protein